MSRFGFLLFLAGPVFAQAPIRGFPPGEWKAQHEREGKARAIAQPERIRIFMERMSEKPHHAGSAGSKAVADYALNQLQGWGLDARLETFEALLPYPTTRLLEMTAPVQFRATLKEPAIPEDKDTAQPGQLPTFNAYSATGDVTAPLLYVNYGVPEDYDYLKTKNIDVKGKIVIARYGHGWRGTKPKLAQEHGAVGCLIYSDPRDDGYFQNETYPKGPMRPGFGVQRGSVVDMTLYPGDPLSPGWASQLGSKRLSRAESTVLLKIPVLPISYGEARPLLESLAGPVAPETWRGALPITYHVGPGPAIVHLKVDFDWTNKPLNDVIVTIPGSAYKDQWILYGNHHDAWVNGATDPVSGAAVLLETARTLATLQKQGWRPKRTIVLALWDGEEFGLVGSTEWAEKHQDELDRSAAVYINSDSNHRGVLAASGSHTLEAFMREVLRDVKDPDRDQSLLEATRERHREQPKAEDPSSKDFRFGALGSGSDYVAFLDHVGVASLNLGFGSGGETLGVYHSIYDTMNWHQHFSDADMSHGKALSQVMTTALLRLADASVLPFEFQTLARTIKTYLEEVQKETKSHTPPDFRDVQTQLTRLTAVSQSYEERLGTATKQADGVPANQLLKVNDILSRTERALLLPDGLPQREWYRHQIYAPGRYTGYGAKTLPGVREAVEAKRWEEANQQARRLSQVLRAICDRIDEASKLLTTSH